MQFISKSKSSSRFLFLSLASFVGLGSALSACSSSDPLAAHSFGGNAGAASSGGRSSLGNGGSDAGETGGAGGKGDTAVPFDSLTVVPLGVYHGGYFSSNTPASPPAYDPVSKRLFHGSEDRVAVDIIDISNPNAPQKVGSIPLNNPAAPIGEPNGIEVINGIVVVSGSLPTLGDHGRVGFFSPNGDQLIAPLVLPGAGRIKLTHDKKHLLITDSGSAADDWSSDPEAHLHIVDLNADLDHAACRAASVGCNLNPTVRTVGFSDWNDDKAALQAKGIRILGPADAFGATPEQLAIPSPTVAQDLNPEAITVSEDDKFAYVTFQRNNAIGKIDLTLGKLVDLWSPGRKDHSLPGNGLDPSDKDGGAHIAEWPVFSLYEADGIHAFDVDGKRYLVTANEGDPYDFDFFREKVRAKDLVLDPVKFPNAADLQSAAKLGRLNVSNLEGDTDGDGDFDEIVTLGSRSFSIFSESDGKLVYDSGDDFEQIMKDSPIFNAAEDENNPDSRSDDRGPEPEHLAVGYVDGRRFVFVNFERIGGFVTYEITDPKKPVFNAYTNTRNVNVNPKDVCGTRGQIAPLTCANAGDLEPEGPLFIPASDSPIGEPLLVLVHEASDSVRLFRFDKTWN